MGDARLPIPTPDVKHPFPEDGRIDKRIPARFGAVTGRVTPTDALKKYSSSLWAAGWAEDTPTTAA
jgi:hypothetical protein